MANNNYTYETRDNHNVNYDRPQHDHYHNNKPFKRTVEKALTWTGIVLHALWAILLVVFGAQLPNLLKNPEVQQQMQQQGTDPSQVAAQSHSVMPLVLMVGFPLIVALIAAFLFKKRIIAGILLILAALLGFFMSASFIAAILWLVAGIMLLVRKPKGHHTHSNHEYEGYRRDNVGHQENKYQHTTAGTSSKHYENKHDENKAFDNNRVDDHYKNNVNNQHDVHRTNHTDGRRDGVKTNHQPEGQRYSDKTSRDDNDTSVNNHLHRDAHDERQSLKDEVKDKGTDAKARFNDVKDDYRR
ncbi:DUF4064 domain-containing protein [Staphylococcus ratti]|uniref:DUF4064 domain-containing protein n=1 Tax=Staphylococcus ratti TaxID=2892440 RepID=A0ABY3PAY4_9STAP|nr:DUF4064 domain-containing protein [Staphylococcus ratti]UEX89454.1 DUF4064 domain-containing protein [Staphylococcus ratti]